MPVMTLPEILQAWHDFLRELAAARSYPNAYALDFGRTHRNPFLDSILPALLYIKMVAILDEALVSYLKSQQLTLPKKFKKSLHGRVEYLNEQGRLANYRDLNAIRDVRNLLAHGVSDKTTWKKLDTDLLTIESELQQLGIIGISPKFEFYGERSAMRSSDDPAIAFEQEYEIGVKKDGKKSLWYTFVRRFHRHTAESDE